MSGTTMNAPGQDGQPPLLQVRGLTRSFPGIGRVVKGVSFDVAAGQTLGLVGESGSGKSTIGRAVLMLPKPSSGSVRFGGVELTELQGNALRRTRRDLQIVFQDPYAALNPRMSIGSYISEPIEIHERLSRAERADRVAELLLKVGLDPAYATRHPHQFSGGQRQRIAIARAISLHPKLIVADEPISALDVSIQAQIVNLLIELQEEMGIAYIFISHDLRVVRRICDRVAVLWNGSIVEIADTAQLYRNPRHSYTQRLLSAIPSLAPSIERQRSQPEQAPAFAASRGGELVEVEQGHFVASGA